MDAKYIDVHCHLDDEKFEEDLEEVIQSAKEKGVLIVHSGINPETNRKAVEIAEKYDIFCSFGLYPVDSILKDFPDVTDDYPRDIQGFDVDEELAWIEEHKDKCVAIGEVGLEYKVVDDTKEVRKAQEDNFRKIIKMAQKIDKPIVIHSRGGELECTEIMEEMGAKRVLMHCFSGKKALIKRGAENGWFFSVPPVIKRLQHFETLVKLVPIEQLVTETDAPYLSPVYAERNEPSNVIISAEKIAVIKEMDTEEVRKILLENAKRLFNL